MGEFAQLATLAPQWKERGGEVLFTLFENNQQAPPSREDALSFEQAAVRGSVDDLVIRVLRDIGDVIPSNFNEPATTNSLPYTVIVNREMVIEMRGANPGWDATMGKMEQLMAED